MKNWGGGVEAINGEISVLSTTVDNWIKSGLVKKWVSGQQYYKGDILIVQPYSDNPSQCFLFQAYEDFNWVTLPDPIVSNPEAWLTLKVRNPESEYEIANKQYVDTSISTLESKIPTDAATQEYVDTKVANYLPLRGGTLTGQLSMNGKRLSNLPSPVFTDDAATKHYVDGNTNLITTSSIVISAVGTEFGATFGIVTPSSVDNYYTIDYMLPNLPKKVRISSISIGSSFKIRLVNIVNRSDYKTFNKKITGFATAFSHNHIYFYFSSPDTSKNYLGYMAYLYDGTITVQFSS